jgi:hypothetical protein
VLSSIIGIKLLLVILICLDAGIEELLSSLIKHCIALVHGFTHLEAKLRSFWFAEVLFRVWGSLLALELQV